MQVDITGHHLEVTAALRAHIGKHCRHIAEQVRPPPGRAHVVLRAGKNVCSCDMLLRVGENEVVAKGEDADMYAAIDRSAEKILRQLREKKGRRLARRHK